MITFGCNIVANGFFSANRKDENYRELAVYYDGTLTVNKFPNMDLSNAEVVFLKYTPGKLMYVFDCKYRQSDTNFHFFNSNFTANYKPTLKKWNFRPLFSIRGS